MLVQRSEFSENGLFWGIVCHAKVIFLQMSGQCQTKLMQLSFISLAPGYPCNSRALVVIVRGTCLCWCPCRREHERGCRHGLMVIIVAGNLSWDLIRDVPWYGMRAGTLLVTRRRRCPALRGSQQILVGDSSASKERMWLPSLLVPGYWGGQGCK